MQRLAVAIAVAGLTAGGCQQPDESVPTPGVGPTPNTGVWLSPTPDIEGIIAVRVAATVEAAPTPTPDPTATPVPTETTAAPSPTPALMPSPISSMREMEVEDIRWPEESVPVVLLKEKEGNRYLPIWIGPLEAGAIAVKLQDIQAERPMTQDLLHSVVSRLGGRAVHVIITDLADNTFYAKIVLMQGENVLELDSRPSDALALALRADVPIFADESVLQQAGFEAEPTNGQSAP